MTFKQIMNILVTIIHMVKQLTNQKNIHTVIKNDIKIISTVKCITTNQTHYFIYLLFVCVLFYIHQ